MDKIDEADETIRQEWQERLALTATEQEPGWEDQYKPGSFGCHELLDRATLLGDMLEAQVLGHPSCALREEWHRLASHAVEALRELSQKVGAEHLAPDGDTTTGEPEASAPGAISGR